MSQFGGFLAGFLFVTCERVGAHLVRENPAVQTLDPLLRKGLQSRNYLPQ